MCAVISGLLAVMLSLSVRNSPHHGDLTPVTFLQWRPISKTYQTRKLLGQLIINMHLWKFVYLNLKTFIASAVSEKWKHMI